MLPPHPPNALKPQRQAGRFFRCRSRGHPPAPTPAHSPLWVGPRALHVHVGTCGPPRAGRVRISPLSWEFLLKAKQTKKVLVLPKFLAAAKWVSSQLPETRGAGGAGLWFWRMPRPPQAPVGAPPWTSGTTLASPPYHHPSTGSRLGYPARLPSGGRKCKVSCGQERKGPSGRRWLASNLQVPSCAQSRMEKLQEQPAPGCGQDVPGEARGRKGQPQSPQGQRLPP